MTIYLLRHFKVQDNGNLWLNSNEFNHWVDTYDTLPLKMMNLDLPKEIELIYCSTLSRAKRTREEFLPEVETIYTDKLMEVGSQVFFDTKIRLYKYAWFAMGSIMWYFNKCGTENRIDTQRRAKELVEELKTLNKTDVLLISHGFFMKVLVEELIEQGFRGKIDSKPMNAKLYPFFNSEILATNLLAKF